MEWIQYLAAILFLLLGAGCALLVVFQLPGTWVMLALAALLEWADRFYLEPGTWTFDWRVLLACLILAVAGEIVEFVAGLLGASRGGASRRGMWGALIGGVAGIFLFTPIFFFVPFFGSLLGAILGTFAGALIGELTAQDRTVRSSMRPALGATVGKVLGTMTKVLVALAMWLVLSLSAFWP